MTVYAADKLSDIRGLCRGIEDDHGALEERLGTSLAAMTAHYRESVDMIEAVRPASPFVASLRAEMERLEWAVLADRDRAPFQLDGARGPCRAQ